MGNKSSELKLAHRENPSNYELYDLVGPNGDGKLIDLVKKAQRTNDYTELDNFIQKHVSKYLYNDGKGELIPVETLVARRCAYTNKLKQYSNTELELIKSSSNMDNLLRFVCFNIDKRGKDGETLLHLCLSYPSRFHSYLAKRLLSFYPNMIHDIKIQDEYYGESPLHQAIANEDPFMVKYLISMGADVNGRCCGRFFCPDDQKNNRKETILNEYPFLPVKTNYKGLSYFGEYPLSFAAVLNQQESVRLLLAHGADPNLQDSNGNTVLHMLVINDDFELFKMIVEDSVKKKVNFNLRNKQDLTPLTLAAQLSRKEIFFFILETIRTNYWTYADISCAAYPLANVDTISENGAIDTNSCLFLILNTDSENHLELLDGVLNDLLHKKWTTYARFRFYLEVLIFTVFYVFITITVFLKRAYYDHLSATNCTIEHETYSNLKDECKCSYLYPTDDIHYPRTIFEIIIILYSLFYVLITINEIYSQKWQLFLKTLFSNPFKIFLLFSIISVFLIIPMRVSCNTYGEDILVTMIIVFLSIHSLHYGRGFRLVCVFVYNINQIVKNDLYKFFLIYSVFLLGFSQMFLLIMQAIDPINNGAADTPVYSSALQSLMDTFILTLGEFNCDFEELPTITIYSVLGEIFFVIYFIVGSIVLLNILIAMMDHTQEVTNDKPNEWIRQWGKTCLAVEQNMNSQERLKKQKNYSHQLSTEQRALVVRWHQSGDERLESREKKELFQNAIKNVENFRRAEL